MTYEQLIEKLVWNYLSRTEHHYHVGVEVYASHIVSSFQYNRKYSRITRKHVMSVVRKCVVSWRKNNPKPVPPNNPYNVSFAEGLIND